MAVPWQDDSLFADLRIVPMSARWVFVVARGVFAVCVVVGGITIWSPFMRRSTMAVRRRAAIRSIV